MTSMYQYEVFKTLLYDSIMLQFVYVVQYSAILWYTWKYDKIKNVKIKYSLNFNKDEFIK